MNDQPYETVNEKEYLTPSENKPPIVFAILSMVFGILSVVWCGGVIPGVLGIVFSVIYKKKGGTNPMATIGFAFGIVGLVLVALLVIFFALYYFLMIFGFAMSSF